MGFSSWILGIFLILFFISAFFITPANTFKLIKNTSKAVFNVAKVIFTDGKPVVGDVVKVFQNSTKGGKNEKVD